MSFMDYLREFQGVDAVCSGRLSHVPVHTAVMLKTLVVCRAANKACDKKKEIRTENRETFFDNPFASANTVSTIYGRVPQS